MKIFMYSLWIVSFCICDIYAADSKYPETTKDKIIVTARLNSENGDVIFTYRNMSRENITLTLRCLDNRERFSLLTLSGFPDTPPQKSIDDEEDEYLSEGNFAPPQGRKITMTMAERRAKLYRVLTLMPGEFVGTTFKIWNFPIWKVLPHKIKKFGAYRLYPGGIVDIPVPHNIKKSNTDARFGAAKEYLRLDAIERNDKAGLPPLKPNIYEKMGIKPYFIIDLPTLEKLQKIAPPTAVEDYENYKGLMGILAD